MPIIFEETYANINDSKTQDSQMTKKKIQQKSEDNNNNFTSCINPNSENKFVNSKSYPTNLASNNNNNNNINNLNGRSLSSTSTSSSSNNDLNSNNALKMTKSKKLFLKRSKKSSKDIIASAETTTIRLVSYIKKNDESEFVNNYQVSESRPPPTIQKNSLSSSLPINSINKKSFVFKKLSIDEDLSNLNNTESEDKPNSKSSNESTYSGCVMEDENAVSGCSNGVVLQQQNNLDIQTPMEFNERPIDVEFVEPNLINDNDMNRNSEIFTETNKSSNLMPPPSDCSFKSKVLYESFRGRTNTLDRRRLNQFNFQKPSVNFKEEMMDYTTSTPIKKVAKTNEVGLKRKDSKLTKHLSVNTDTSSLCPLANENLFKY